MFLIENECKTPIGTGLSIIFELPHDLSNYLRLKIIGN